MFLRYALGGQERRARCNRFQGTKGALGMLLVRVRWYVASPLSTRPMEALMQHRAVSLDPATVQC